MRKETYINIIKKELRGKKNEIIDIYKDVEYTFKMKLKSTKFNRSSDNNKDNNNINDKYTYYNNKNNDDGKQHNNNIMLIL